MDVTDCAPETKGTQGHWQAHRSITMETGGSCGGNKRPQPALVPGPGSVAQSQDWFLFSAVGTCPVGPAPRGQAHGCAQDSACQGRLFRREWTVEGNMSWG